MRRVVEEIICDMCGKKLKKVSYYKDIPIDLEKASSKTISISMSDDTHLCLECLTKVIIYYKDFLEEQSC